MGCCDCGPSETEITALYRRVLIWALVINAGMFGVEIVAGLVSGSVSLQADAIDFLGDAGNYGISLVVVGMALAWRARAALLKGLTMGAFGLWVAGSTLWRLFHGGVPDAATMGAVGLLALAANVSVALMLYKYRQGDSNMRSVWLCSRNDAISNVAVLAAAFGVFGTGTNWPDLAVAAVMAGLALSSAWSVIRHARSDLAMDKAAQAAE
jgi:cation diffusion facilitator family transporter